MKKIAFIFLLSFSFIGLESCDKSKVKMTIVKDCTGVYLQNDGRDYFVCNDEILDNYSAGTKIKVSYDVLEECFGILEPITCELAHPFESKIEVTTIH